MKQYYEMKSKHPDAILLFRVGDFYETFEKDAIAASEILGITLTKRANGSASYVELAGFPHHSIDSYLPKLVRAGKRVAICEQLEDPKKTKKIVKRGIVELVTPGVSFNDNVLENRENNFLACVHLAKKQTGIAFIDVSTGEFYAAEGSKEYIDKLISNFQPKEVLFQKGKEKIFHENFVGKFYTFTLDEWAFNENSANDKLLSQFNTKNLKGFGIQDLNDGVIAAGAVLHYLDITKHGNSGHIQSISRVEEDKYVWLDRFTVRNLELLSAGGENAKSLSQIMDRTITPMGGRMLKRWIALPLKDVNLINKRLSIVDYFYQNKNSENVYGLDDNLREIGDLERIISKLAVGRVNPRELIQLKSSLLVIPEIKSFCQNSNLADLNEISEQLNSCKSVTDKISQTIKEEPNAHISKAGVIADGFNQDLDELRKIAYSGKDFLVQMQVRESERTGIPSLKIGFNNVFGYYIEVRNTHKDKVPEEWIRKQTLVSAERYITEELKEYEEKILGAEGKIIELETKIYNELIISISEFISNIQINAMTIAKLDCLLSFSYLANTNNYSKPIVDDSNIIDIKSGRHPVIEEQLSIDEEYIANDVFLDNEKQQVIIITGPNMAGKSALLRQTALIVLMAQIGCFVPAEQARIGYVDKIFTRVGASDNISAGESTFMVEMNEAASILNNLSNRSLVLFDELGRGTSTYDGISIAWSIVEYIHEHKKSRAKTLFATHYHELNELESSLARVKNYNVSVKQLNNEVIFLRKLIPGGSNHSFGINVAGLAGMPKLVVKRANHVLSQLEAKAPKRNIGKSRTKEDFSDAYQMSLFQLDDPVLESIRDQIKGLDINNLTPLEALNKLSEIKKIVGI
jgi:DNA mismatch repair protein MutS